MDDLTLIQSINEAIEILLKASREVASGSLSIWRISRHAAEHLDRQIADFLRA